MEAFVSLAVLVTTNNPLAINLMAARDNTKGSLMLLVIDGERFRFNSTAVFHDL